MTRVLVTGGSGYLGQFLVCHLAAAGYDVSYTYNTLAPPAGALPGAAFKVDFAAGAKEGLSAVFEAGGPIDVVVNTAAISQPPLCEQKHDMVRAVNAPLELIAALCRQRQATGVEALLVHISTDQVYDGQRPWWREDDEAIPVNAYARSKLEGEQLVRERWPHHAILRSSTIYGAAPPVPVARNLFVQWAEQRIASGQPTDFFHDEFRCPILVDDICAIVQHLAERRGVAELRGTYNMGGPDRLSRVDIARAIAAHRGHSNAPIRAVPSGSVQRGYNSPQDISMDMSKLQKSMPTIKLTPFVQGLARVFPTVTL